MAIEIKLINGEEFRDELLLVRNQINQFSLGKLVQITVSYINYRNKCETQNQTLKSPNYQCVRELLTDTIEKLVEELDIRERRYLSLQKGSI